MEFLNKLKAGQKLIGGMSAIVIMIIVVWLVVGNGLSDVNRYSLVKDDFNFYVITVEKMISTYKDYVITENQENVKKLQNLDKEFDTRLEQTKSRLFTEEDRKRLDTMAEAQHQYFSALENYESAHTKIISSRKDLDNTAKIMDNQAKSLNIDQNNQLSRDFSKSRVEKVKDSYILLGLLKNIRINEKDYIRTHNPEFIKNFNDNLLSEVKEELRKTKSKMTRKVNQDQLDKMIIAVDNYAKALNDNFQANVLKYNARDEMNIKIQELMDKATEALDVAEVKMENVQSSTENKVLFFNILILLISVFIAIYINYTITGGVKNINKSFEIITQSINNGKLDERITTDNLSIDYISIAERVNELIEAFVKPLKVTTDYIKSIAVGDNPPKITDEYKGDFNKIKNNLNKLIDVNIEISEAAKKIAEGDLTVVLEKRSANDILINSLIKMTENLKTLIQNMKENMNTIAAGSEELTAVSSQLLSGSNTTSEQVNSVAGATEQLTANINAIATATEEINVNISNVSGNSEKMTDDTNSIANTIEELTQSLKTVAENAENATKIANSASEKSNNATIVMNELGSAAKEIGKVTEVIKKIAEQTNLLALNATIEAASAGEAGKGFAVVAKEIKELAKQSAKAADNISEEIDNIQTKTSGAVETISDVSKTINEVNEKISNIDRSVQEQTINSSEITKTVNHNADGIKSISRAINEISTGVAEVSKNIGEGAKGTESISNDIGNVTRVANDSMQGAKQVQESAEDLAKMAAELNSIMSRFRL